MITFSSILQSLFLGFLTTVKFFGLTLVMALPLGLVICLGSMSGCRLLRWLTRCFVWVIRGTPLMLQILIVFFGPGLMFGITVGSSYRQTAALIAFVVNYAAYFSEIYRGGIESIPKGQYEAIQVLGMTKTQGFFRVILLQVVKRIVPPMSNEIITLVKDTSLARIIAAYELTFAGYSFMKSNGLTWPLFYTGVFYLLFVGILTLLFNFIERKLDYFK